MKISNEELISQFLKAFNETLIIVGYSLILAIIFGILIGLILFTTSNEFFYKNKIINGVLGFTINIIRSVPFLILLVVLLPYGKFIVQTTIGYKAVIFPLAIAAIAFYARLAENAFSEVNYGSIEAAIATGASKFLVIRKVIIPEAFPQLIRHINVTAISILGYSALAGIVGGGGIGDLAIRYGYQRYNTKVLIICLIILIILVQLINLVGNFIAKHFDHR